MALLEWKHGGSKAAARAALEAELSRHGHADKVRWSGDTATVSVGLGVVLSLSAEVTADAVVVHKCGGAAGGTVLAECRKTLARLFPGGEAG